MMAWQLIEALQAAIDEHGDHPVAIKQRATEDFRFLAQDQVPKIEMLEFGPMGTRAFCLQLAGDPIEKTVI